MADEMDRVQDLADAQRAEALTRRQLLRAAAGQDVAPAYNTICTGCGEQIAPARLAAMPYTRRCTECATAAEMRRAG